MRRDKDGNPIIDNLDQVDDFVSERNAKARKDKMWMFKEDGPLKVDHGTVAELFINYINNMPGADKHVKEILIMRIGSPINHGKPMSHMAIALAKGMTLEEVQAVEFFGKKLMQECLAHVPLLEGAMMNTNSSRPIETLEKVARINMGQRS